jgi:hypothetical protein
MKKYILIASIAIIAVLNFTLVKNKTGEVTLKSITELSSANAELLLDHCTPSGSSDSTAIDHYLDCGVWLPCHCNCYCTGKIPVTYHYKLIYQTCLYHNTITGKDETIISHYAVKLPEEDTGVCSLISDHCPQ